MKKSNFFRFVLSIKQQEYLKSKEFDKYSGTGGGSGQNNRKKFYKVRLKLFTNNIKKNHFNLYKF